MGKYTIKDWKTIGQDGKAILSMTPWPIVEKKNQGVQGTSYLHLNGTLDYISFTQILYTLMYDSDIILRKL